jgi:hypothetical protein
LKEVSLGSIFLEDWPKIMRKTLNLPLLLSNLLTSVSFWQDLAEKNLNSFLGRKRVEF